MGWLRRRWRLLITLHAGLAVLLALTIFGSTIPAIVIPIVAIAEIALWADHVFRHEPGTISERAVQFFGGCVYNVLGFLIIGFGLIAMTGLGGTR